MKEEKVEKDKEIKFQCLCKLTEEKQERRKNKMEWRMNTRVENYTQKWQLEWRGRMKKDEE